MTVSMSEFIKHSDSIRRKALKDEEDITVTKDGVPIGKFRPAPEPVAWNGSRPVYRPEDLDFFKPGW